MNRKTLLYPPADNRNFFIYCLLILIVFALCICIKFLYELDKTIQDLRKEIHVETPLQKCDIAISNIEFVYDRVLSVETDWKVDQTDCISSKFQNVELSAYTISADETGSTLGITSSGTKAIPGRTAAVSRDLRHLMGKKIYIKGRGTWVIEDTMHARYKKSIDLCLPNKKDAIIFGRQKSTMMVLD